MTADESDRREPDPDGAMRFGVVVDAAERLQVRRVEALDPDRQPVDPG